MREFLPYLYYTVTLVYLFLIVYLIIRKNRSLLSYFTIGVLILLALWSLADVFLHRPGTDKESALFWINVTSAGGFLSYPFYVYFAAALAKKKKLLKKWWFNFLLIGPPVFLFLSQVSGNLVVDLQRHIYGWRPIFPDGVIVKIHLIHFMLSGFFTMFFFIKYWKGAASTVERKQAKILSISFLGIFAVWMLNPLFIYMDIHSPDLIVLSGLIWCGGLAYTVKRYDLMPIDPLAAAKKIMGTMNDGLILTDSDGKIMDVNNALINMASVDFQDSGSLDLSDLFDYGVAQLLSVPADIRNATAALKLNKLPVSISATANKNSMGDFIGNIIIVRDVSRAKKMENILSRQAPLVNMGQLAAGVAHELNNPLAAIKNCLELVKRNFDAPDEKALRRIGIIDDSVERMSLIIKDILMFSRGGSSDRQKTHINSVIRNAVLLCRFQMEDINLVMELGPLPDIMARRDQILQVFINLFTNAAAAVRENPGSVSEISIKTKESGGYIDICLRDSGAGIDEEIKEKIFQPLFTTKKEGTGLGLSIVKKIIEGHNGTIRVQSKKNQYTEFCIKLPTK